MMKKADKIIILHLNTYDGEGESIFGVMPTNFNLQNEQKKMEEQQKAQEEIMEEPTEEVKEEEE